MKDSASGETIIGATVTVSQTSRTILTNQYGFYSVTLEGGEYDISVSHVAYFTSSQKVSLSENLQLDFLMNSRAAALDEVVVYSRRRDANVRDAQMGKIDLTINQIRNIPAFLGEVDILKTIQLLPGVQSAGEGNAG
ncbi:MAG: carboxypeptidase-like regulatory domain-containing protein, partial [Flavisolibacter sp.]|nr:carboxypeptidase-like regulatory domain-containing protein [Flavisolibacter sp.]